MTTSSSPPALSAIASSRIVYAVTCVAVSFEDLVAHQPASGFGGRVRDDFGDVDVLVEIVGSLLVGRDEHADEKECGEEVHERTSTEEFGALPGCLGLHAFGVVGLAVLPKYAHESADGKGVD